jgi:dihydrofolate reductase
VEVPVTLMRISIIAAVAENGVIGRGGELPWHLAADLKRFKQLTMGHTLIMGRKTWESIGRPLPGRKMVVITRQKDFRSAGIEIVASLDAALEIAAALGDVETFIIGGAEIYRLALPRADRLYLTRVHANVDGDAIFPDVDSRAWKLTEIEERPADASNEFSFNFEQLERVSADQ